MFSYRIHIIGHGGTKITIILNKLEKQNSFEFAKFFVVCLLVLFFCFYFFGFFNAPEYLDSQVETDGVSFAEDDVARGLCASLCA